MNNLRKIFCAVLVFAILCSALAFAISAETTATTPLRRLVDGGVPANTKSSAEGNLYRDFATWSPDSQASYGNTVKQYIVFEGDSDDGYYLSRVESDGKDITSSDHNHINLYMFKEDGSTHPELTKGDVIVYESDMYFEYAVLSNFGIGLNIRDAVTGKGISNKQDYDLGAKLPTGRWFRFTLIADFDSNTGYYYVDGEILGTVSNFVTGNSDPLTTTYKFSTLRWQFYNTTIKHGQSFAYDNVYANIYKNDDLGTYVMGGKTLDGFDKATEYTLREVLPIATIDGTPYYSADAIKAKLSASLNPVEMEILRDSNAAISIVCDATIKTNGIDILLDTPEGAKVTTKDGIIEVDVLYTPAYTVVDGGIDASFINCYGDDNISIIDGSYWYNDSYVEAYKVTPYAGGDSYFKFSPKLDVEALKLQEAYTCYYTNRYYLKMDDFYVIDFDIATEGEYADMSIIPVIAHDTVDNGRKANVLLNGASIKIKDLLDPSNEWTHITAIGDIANNVMYLFVNDVLVSANYGEAYNAAAVEENNIDLTEEFKGTRNDSEGPLNLIEVRFSLTGEKTATKADESALLKNLAVRRFAASENDAISTAVENATLGKWENNKNTTNNEKLPSIIVVDGKGYGNVVVANQVIAQESDTPKDISFRADFETPVIIDTDVVLEANGIGEYEIIGEGAGPVYTEVDGEPAIIAASTSISEKGGKIYVTKVTEDNAYDTCALVYWGSNEDWDEEIAIYYPAGTEIAFLGDKSFVQNIIKDGVLYGFGGWVNEDEIIVESFGTAKAGDEASYYANRVEEETDITVPGAMYNLSLYTDYAINLFIPADVYVGEQTTTVTAGGVKYVVLSQAVAATEIAEAVEFVVTYTYGGKEYTEYLDVSVIEYAEKVMASDYSAMLKKTIMAALNYSETAIEELVDEAGNEQIKAILNAEANAAYSPKNIETEMGESTDTEGLTFIGSAFIHIDATPDFVFVLTPGFKGTVTFTYKGVDGEVTVSKEVDAAVNKYVVLDDVKVYDMTAIINITAEGNMTGNGEYSLATYINGMGETYEESKTAEALYVYATVAKAYKIACNKVAAG